MDHACRSCGYDLAGLPQPGDAVTCPECAAVNPMPPAPIERVWEQLFACAVYILGPFGATVAALILAAQLPANSRLGTPVQIAWILAIAWSAGALAMLTLSPIRRNIERRRFRLALVASALAVLLTPAIVAALWVALMVAFA